MIPKKRKKKKSLVDFFFSILLGFFVLAIVGLLVFSNLKIKERRKELTSQTEALKEEIQKLEERNAQLKSGISQSLSPDFLEKEARERLGLKKPGEEVVVVKKVETEEELKETTKETGVHKFKTYVLDRTDNALSTLKTFWQKFLEILRIK